MYKYKIHRCTGIYVFILGYNNDAIVDAVSKKENLVGAVSVIYVPYSTKFWWDTTLANQLFYRVLARKMLMNLAFTFS